MKMSFFKVAAAAAVLAGTSTAQASPLDFETFAGTGLPAGPLAHGTLIDNGTIFDLGGGLTATITTASNGNTNKAQIYNSRINGVGQDPDLERPNNVATPNDDSSAYLSNVLIISDNGNTGSSTSDEGLGGSITFDFNRRVNISGVTVIDAEQGSNEIDIAVNGNTPSVTDIFVGDDLWQALDLDLNGVNSVTFFFGRSGAIDNLLVSEVPVPAAGILLLSALGGFAGVRRLRKSASA